jgi:hypothetical protein
MRLALGILAITFVIYLPISGAPLVYEDHNWIAAAAPGSDHGWKSWPERVPWPNRWATHASYQMQSVSGVNVAALHLWNLWLHLACGVCVWLLARSWRLSPVACLLAMAIFLWHPLNTAAASYISARSDLLLTLFTLLAVVSARFWGWKALPVVIGGCLLAGSSKEMGALSIVVVLVSVGAWRWAPQAALLVAPLGLWYVMRWPEPSAWIDAVSAQVVSVWRIVGLIVVPVGMSIDPDPWMVPMSGRLIAAFALAASAVWVWRRANPLLTWAALVGGVMLLPRVLIPTYEPIHDQHAYLAMAAVSVWLGSMTEGVFA